MRILIIDDDEQVARALSRVLRQHQVSVELDARRALDLVVARRRAGCPFDVVVCDQNMPGWTGRDILAELREHGDDAVLILMSGDPGALRMLGDADAVLLKPFRSEELLGCVSHAFVARSRTLTAKLRVFRRVEVAP
jgi:DNA-binding response OmpR family regulator